MTAGRAVVMTAVLPETGTAADLESAEDDDGLVVEVRGAGLEVSDCLQDGVDCGLRGGVMLGLE